MRNHKGSGAAVGWPDDVFFFGKKQSVWVEFKAPGGTLSPMQESVMRELLDRHQCFLCIDDFDKFKTVVDEFVAAYGAR